MAERAESATRPGIAVAGLAVTSALGRGTEAQLPPMLTGTPAFGPVNRFDASPFRVQVAATLPDVAELPVELAVTIADACTDAGMGRPERATTPLFLAVHGGAGVPALAAGLAEAGGLAGVGRVYTTACVSGTTALADVAALIRAGRLQRAVVAAGYLVEPDQYALFDAGRALAVDGVVRPFSRGRQGLLLGDAVVAVVLESDRRLAERGRAPVAEVVGWARTGDAHHPCQPAPDGRGLARAIHQALDRAGIEPDCLGYINANASGAVLTDAAEAAAMQLALGSTGARIPISSSKSVHGHALEASGLLEFAVTVLSLAEGKLGVNAGFLGPAADCPLDVIADAPRQLTTPYAMTLNSAFGGANTALVVAAPGTTRAPAAAGAGPVAARATAETTWRVDTDGEPPAVPGFVQSSFNPLAAAVASRCLIEHFGEPEHAQDSRQRTGLILVSRSGDQVSAETVSTIVAAGRRPGPLHFFQSVPNSIAGHIAAQWGLAGPVICLSPQGDPLAEGRSQAELVLADGDADQMLLIALDQQPGAAETEFARARLLTTTSDAILPASEGETA